MPEASSPSQIATSRVVVNVFEQLLAAVHRGDLRPGQRISDGDLADEYGVSRTPVREALVRLRELGIVEASASRFTRIAVVSPRQTAEALIVWVALYRALIDELIPAADPDLVAELEGSPADLLYNDVLLRHSSNAALQRSIVGAEHVVRLGDEHLAGLVGEGTLARAQGELIDAARRQDTGAAHDSLDFVRTMSIPSD